MNDCELCARHKSRLYGHASRPRRTPSELLVGRHASDLDDDPKLFHPTIAKKAQPATAEENKMSLRSGQGAAMNVRSEHTRVDSEARCIQGWLPGNDLDLTVLAAYLRTYIDDTATIRQSPSPQGSRMKGFIVSAKATVGVEQLEDIWKDSQSWAAETTTGGYWWKPYPYLDSDTWLNRSKTGPTGVRQLSTRKAA